MIDPFRLFSDYWWSLPIVGAAIVAYRFLGWRGLAAVATFGLGGALYTKGKTDQRAALERKAEAERLKALKERQTVNENIDKLDPDSARDRLRGWVLPDDKRE